MLPQMRTTRFFDRVNVYQDLDRLQGRAAGITSFRSVALHGLSGVGESSIASTYMETQYNANAYDVCLWMQGEKPASLRQSFTEIAMRLKLPGAQPQTPDDNLIIVQDWFQSTGKSRIRKRRGHVNFFEFFEFLANCAIDSNWLIVYDNVESAETLVPYWHGSNKGKAIIATRNHSLGFEPAFEGLEVTAWDNITRSQFLLWLLKKNIGRDLEAESDSALALSERLSRHALAISHMAGLIHKYNFSIQDYTAMYLKNPHNAHERDELKALRGFLFQSLDEDSNALVDIISF